MCFFPPIHHVLTGRIWLIPRKVSVLKITAGKTKPTTARAPSLPLLVSLTGFHAAPGAAEAPDPLAGGRRVRGLRGAAPAPLRGPSGSRGGRRPGLARAETAAAGVGDRGGWGWCASTEGRRRWLCLFSYRAFHRQAKIRHWGSGCVNIPG